MTLENRFLQHEKARCLAYRKLADLYRPGEPDLSPVLTALADALAQIGSDALPPARRMRDAYCSAASAPVGLEVDFARLFAGPFLMLAPPYGSVYLEEKRILMGDSTMDVQRHYQALGLEIADDFKEAPDHIAAELEFMHLLIAAGAEAAAAQDHATLLDSLQRQQIFLTRHLGAWVPRFTAKIAEHAATDFYRGLAETTRCFVAEELETIAALEMQPAV